MPSAWYQNAIFYGVDIRRFQDSNDDGFGDIQGLISRLDYLVDLGVNALWLLPFFDTPLRDNGYDIRDYYRVDPRVGTLEDFLELAEQCKTRDIRLLLDVVMNHTSDEHPWFEASRRDPDSHFRGYYIWSEQIPEVTEDGGPVFPGEEDKVWTYDPVAKAYYHHRFYHFQPELYTANPDVREEIHRVVDFWLTMGADGFRFDAAPLMLENMDAPAWNKREAHSLFKDLHKTITNRRPDAAMLAEANLQMSQMDEFFGGGSEMNLLFNFLLGPHILLALAEQKANPVSTYLKDLLVPPETDEWVNFLRNLDELSLEILPDKQKEVIYQAFAPQEDMKIYNRGIRRRLAPMMAEGDPADTRNRLELVFSLCFSFPGVPMFIYGDEIGMGDDLSLPGRHSVRLPMQWSAEVNGGFSRAGELIAPALSSGPYGYSRVNVSSQQEDPGSFLNFMKGLIAVWKTCPELGQRNAQVIEKGVSDDRILAHCYDAVQSEKKTLMMLHNLSGEVVSSSIPYPSKQPQDPQTLLGNGEIESSGEQGMTVRMPAFGYLWLRV